MTCMEGYRQLPQLLVEMSFPPMAVRTIQEPRSIAFPNGNGTIAEIQSQIQTMSINKSSLKPKGGVGIAFSDRINMESGQREFYVQKIFPDGPAATSGLVSFNDVLIEVNGEKVSNWDIWTLSQKIPGPVDSPVLLRMKSASRNTEYDVEIIRKIIVKKSDDENVEENKEDSKELDEKEILEARMKEIIEMKKLGITIASPGFSIEPCPKEWFNGEKTGSFVIGNVTKGSSAEKVGFTHGELIEEVDGKDVAGFSEDRIKGLLTDAIHSVVQIHTDKRVIPVVRDCAPLLQPPEPPQLPRPNQIMMPPPPPFSPNINYVSEQLQQNFLRSPAMAPVASFRPQMMLPSQNIISVGNLSPRGNEPSWQVNRQQGNLYSSMNAVNMPQYSTQDGNFGYMPPPNQPQYSTVQRSPWGGDLF
ncbi:hypothetical protein GUITHDRAFT_147605 [Guillardia theta CCMP2712]|uniref:PDZ domain-containing protein n=1 Tax=Guillardia theta (strain CCMP2712) TaxID=905079 RepID=L1ICD5_GUITC|nr:hypothetical protein GUITHDRAFT_147605 [Guillardia theta CCMP2712]EKX33878.1 hypothetical protein GUITHDRAFT_147605 [Guillardia theta CCMP2712]|eukprot:XP_005820858.1 hypothetical protein GUITHDRAFT_147605 [Guillardia theta CCMP2712]